MKVKHSYLIIASVVLYSCSAGHRNDSQLISDKYQKQLAEIRKTDSLIFAEVQYKYASLDALFGASFEHREAADAKNGAAMQSSNPDSAADAVYYTTLQLVCKEHPALYSTNKIIKDSANAHILAYTSSNENEELLTILNMDEDNRSFRSEYDYAGMPLLLCNYDDGGLPIIRHSLILRPFEARIYKVR